MRAWGDKFICIFNPDKYGGWISFITWKLGHRGPYIIRAQSENELREKLSRLDPTIRFHGRCDKKQQPEVSQSPRASLADAVLHHLGGRKENDHAPTS
jgi:hypothetical protein